MEVDANGHVIQRERSLWRLGREGELAILVAIPQDTTFGEFYRLIALNGLALSRIGTIQRKVDLLSADDTYRHGGLLLQLHRLFLQRRMLQKRSQVVRR